jgi:hypothetical protein
MTEKQATRRYFKIFIPAMMIYLVWASWIQFLEEQFSLWAMELYSMSIIPIWALLFVFWAHWRFINEIDEFMRSVQIKALLFGLACILVFSTAWWIFEDLASAPVSELSVIMPIFAICYSVAVVYMNLIEYKNNKNEK